MLGSGDAISGGYTEIVWLECPNFRERLRYDHVMECDSVVGRKREFYFLIRSNGWSDNNNVSWEVTKDSVVYEIIPETFKVVGDKGFVKLNLSKPISVLEV
ncbi:hypothetical protein [Photobacterium lutimaris]|uniref:Uncharacterized protein n=1 Tax=Photobacterium lutimaris TaxID=388278 RepID=A0A2T3J4K2_9GAMM|nr:hypothetical protein [Photobacterium lutimaris]PSU36206.1 hypothetical protein C9I99_04185 [Photobacterium lutimaris]